MSYHPIKVCSECNIGSPLKDWVIVIGDANAMACPECEHIVKLFHLDSSDDDGEEFD